MQQAANMARWGTDWRPLLGVGPELAGSMVERVLAIVVAERAVADHQAALKKAEASNG